MKKVLTVLLATLAVALLFVSCKKEPKGDTVTYKSCVTTIDDYSETKAGAMTAWDASSWKNEGYVLDGWYTKENAEGTYYAVGSSLTGSMTLYAHWVDDDLTFEDIKGKKDEMIAKGAGASKGFENIKDVVVPSVYHGKKVTAVDFFQCSYLESFSFEKASNITSISGIERTNLVTVDLSETKIIEVSDSMFNYCVSLTSVALPSTVTAVGNNAFSYCSKLKSLTIPGKIASIGSKVLEYSGIETVTFGGIAESALNFDGSIASDAFSNALYLKTINLGESADTLKNTPLYEAKPWGAGANVQIKTLN